MDALDGAPANRHRLLIVVFTPTNLTIRICMALAIAVQALQCDAFRKLP
tara:strand:- start:865 stop:1011 length:147 start_codon:yes stop_codon:yes gene_type:complete